MSLPADLVDTLSDILADILVADLRAHPPDHLPVITRLGPNEWDITDFLEYFFVIDYLEPGKHTRSRRIHP